MHGALGSLKADKVSNDFEFELVLNFRNPLNNNLLFG